MIRDDDASGAHKLLEPMLIHLNRGDLRWVSAGIRLMNGWAAGRAGDAESALSALVATKGAVDHAPAGAPDHPGMVCASADIRWRLVRTEDVDVVERNLATKVIEPDFCYTEFDGRWAMGQVCALTGRLDEARAWFQRGIDRVTEQGAVLLIPHIAADAALAELRAGPAGDHSLARRRLGEARREVDRIGLPRLVPRLDALAAQLDG